MIMSLISLVSRSVPAPATALIVVIMCRSISTTFSSRCCIAHLVNLLHLVHHPPLHGYHNNPLHESSRLVSATLLDISYAASSTRHYWLPYDARTRLQLMIYLASVSPCNSEANMCFPVPFCHLTASPVPMVRLQQEVARRPKSGRCSTYPVESRSLQFWWCFKHWESNYTPSLKGFMGIWRRASSREGGKGERAKTSSR